ncbi:MAG: hypothetical protein ABI670_15395 [Chloroflexota bacterium]
MNDYFQLKAAYKNDFSSLRPLLWVGLLVFIVALFSILGKSQFSLIGASDELPDIPPYPGATVIEKVTHDAPPINKGNWVAERIVMEINTEARSYKGLGGFLGSPTTAAFDEFSNVLSENKWVRSGWAECNDYVWWYTGHEHKDLIHWDQVDRKRVWTLEIESGQSPGKEGVTRLTLTVTRGVAGCVSEH